MKDRSPILPLTLLLVGCGDTFTHHPGDLSSPAGDEDETSASLAVVVTVSPSFGHLPLRYWYEPAVMRFAATVTQGFDTLDVPVSWRVLDTTVAAVDTTGWLEARGGGHTILLAEAMSSVHAAAVIVEDLDVNPRSSLFTQGVGRADTLLAGRPLFVQTVVTADTANTWRPAGQVRMSTQAPQRYAFFPMEAPKAGLPVGIQRDDYELEDSTFRVVIPADSIGPDAHSRGFGVTWNKRFTLGHTGRSLTTAPLPDFHLVLVPVLLAESPDTRIVEWTRGLAADSFRLSPVRRLLPIPFDYSVTVLDPFTTEQDLKLYTGWSGLLSEIDSIRSADGKRAYYYGVVIPPRDSPLLGMARLGYPASVGNLYALPHELGHNMGLLHAPCGGPDMVDPEYPYEDGRTGTWGYNFWNQVVVNPEVSDMMGYCTMAGISDYHFKKALTYRREREHLWWDDAAADMLLPEIIADPVLPGWRDWDSPVRR